MAASAEGGYLSPYRVLDLTDERGLLAGHLMAQLGADVIQVEPPGGSSARQAAPYDPAAPAGQQSLFWSAYAAGKRGVAIAYDRPEGRDALLELARTADVLIASADAGGMEALGLGYEDLRAVNPRLVYVSITPFGAQGPKAHYADSDLVLWASGGPLGPNRAQDGTPLRISAPQAYHQGAMDAACGAMMALTARVQTGRGQLVEVSTQQSVLLCNLFGHLAAAVGHKHFGFGRSAPDTPPDPAAPPARMESMKWPVRDGVIEMNIMIGPALGRFANSLFRWIKELGELPAEFEGWDWAGLQARIDAGEIAPDAPERARQLAGRVMARYTINELMQIAQQKGMMLAPITTVADLPGNIHFKARGFFQAVEEAGRERLLPLPYATGSGAPAALRPAPRLGEHDGDVSASRASGTPSSAGEAAAADVRPLAGLKVADFAWIVAGPLVGRALADFGATVVRVESSERIDTARFSGPFVDGKLDPRTSVAFEGGNANKLGMTLDLRRPEGLEVAYDLVRWADVVTDSFVSGQMAKFGLDWPKLKAINPNLIMISSSLMGQTGPHAAITGFGNVGAALSAMQTLVGLKGQPPIGPYGPYSDYVAPRLALLVLLAALDHRRRTGESGYLDISQVETTIALIAPQILDYLATGRVAAPDGNRDEQFAPNGVFRTNEPGRWVAITARSDAEWRTLARLVGGSALEDDARFANLASRKQNEDALEARIGAWTQQRTGQEVERELQALGVPAHLVAESEDIMADPQLLGRNAFVKLPHPMYGAWGSVIDAARFTLSETPAQYLRPAPTFGRDNDQVLTEILGYPADKVAELKAQGVLV